MSVMREERIARAKRRGEAYGGSDNTMESLEHAVECMDRLVRNYAERFYETEDTRYIWPARWERIKRHLRK